MFQPDNGTPIPETKKTISNILMIMMPYIAALLYDDEPNKS
jgi:hypothetical protein